MSDASSVAALVKHYPAEVRRLVQATRRWVKATLPGVSERADLGARLIAYSFGPGYTGAVCTLILSQTGVKLGLVGGASLPDPQRLLAVAAKCIDMWP